MYAMDVRLTHKETGEQQVLEAIDFDYWFEKVLMKPYWYTDWRQTILRMWRKYPQ